MFLKWHTTMCWTVSLRHTYMYSVLKQKNTHIHTHTQTENETNEQLQVHVNTLKRNTHKEGSTRVHREQTV